MKTDSDVDSHDNGDTANTRTPQKFVFVQDNGRQRHSDNETAGEEEPPKGAADFEEAITACGYGKFHYLLLLAIIPVCSAQVFSSLTMSFVIPIAECDLQLTNIQKGALNAGVYAGTFIGAFFWGFASDVFGRKKIIIIGFLLDSLFNFSMSIAHKFWLILLFKIGAGFCISGPIAAVYSYVAETHDSKRRQRVLMINGAIAAFFQAVHPAVAYLVIPLQFRYPLIPGVVDFTSWRLFIIISSIPSFFAMLAFIFVPESPKFLMSKGRTPEALNSFRKIYALNTGNPGYSYPIEELQVPPKQKEISETSKGGFLRSLHGGLIQIRPLFCKPYRNTALILFTIQACLMLSMNTIRSWVPQLFASLDEAKRLASRSNSTDINDASTVCDLLRSVMPHQSTDVTEHTRLCLPISGEVYLRSLIVSGATAFSFLISTALIGRVGRKNLAKMCFISAAAMVISVNWATSSDIFMALLAVYTAMIRNSFTVMSTVTVDVFPTAFRSVAISLGLNCGRIASLTGTLVFPVLLSVNCSAIFFGLGGLLILAAALLMLVTNRVEKH